MVKPNKRILDMLVAHAKSGDRGMTAGELAHAGGYKSFETTNALYGRFGREVAEALRIDLPQSMLREDTLATGVLAQGGETRDGEDNFVWVMYPELRSAVLGNTE